MSLYVETSGDGPPLVMLHGFASHGGVFASVVPALARRYRVHVVDLPGHGHSSATADTLDAYAHAVATAIDSIGPVTLLGWSFGGQVALRLAQMRPQQVEICWGQRCQQSIGGKKFLLHDALPCRKAGARQRLSATGAQTDVPVMLEI